MLIDIFKPEKIKAIALKEILILTPVQSFS